MASRSSSSSVSSDTTMLDAPTHVPLTPARPRHPSLPAAPPSQPRPDPAFSLLLSLPRELRNRVYTFVLAVPGPFWYPHPTPARDGVTTALLRASRQLHREAGPVLYADNIFVFGHPSDCNVFRVVASPFAQHIQNVFFRIRDKDVRLWTAYVGSRSPDRSLRADLPRLKSLCILLRCSSAGTQHFLARLGMNGPAAPPGVLGVGAVGGVGVIPPPLAMAVQAVQTALSQQVAAMQQQIHDFTHAAGVTGDNAIVPGAHPGHTSPPVIVPGAHPGHTSPPVLVPTGAHPGQHQPATLDAAAGAQPPVPPPPPPPPAMPFATFAAGAVPHHHPQPPAAGATRPSNILTNFMRFERELGVDSLCLGLGEALHDPPSPAGDAPTHDPATHTAPPHRRPVPEVKIICILRASKPEIARLLRLYPDELSAYRGGARTPFGRVHGADVCLEVDVFDGVQGP